MVRLFPASQVEQSGGSFEWKKELKLRADNVSAALMILDTWDADLQGKFISSYKEHPSVMSLFNPGGRSIPCIGDTRVCPICTRWMLDFPSDRGVKRSDRMVFNVALLSLYVTSNGPGGQPVRVEVDIDGKTPLAPGQGWSTRPWEDRIFLVNTSRYPHYEFFQNVQRETGQSVGSNIWIWIRRQGPMGSTYSWMAGPQLDENQISFRDSLKNSRHDIASYVEAREKDALEYTGYSRYVGQPAELIPPLNLTFGPKVAQGVASVAQQPAPYAVRQPSQQQPQQCAPAYQVPQMQQQPQAVYAVPADRVVAQQGFMDVNVQPGIQLPSYAPNIVMPAGSLPTPQSLQPGAMPMHNLTVQNLMPEDDSGDFSG